MLLYLASFERSPDGALVRMPVDSAAFIRKFDEMQDSQ
jgi:hypothetical protein